ncbi:putative hNH endonuclease [Pseudomonas aeruginosa]|nr:putative hNH endonuclease [Pseudomonas aeruginosa]
MLITCVPRFRDCGQIGLKKALRRCRYLHTCDQHIHASIATVSAENAVMSACYKFSSLRHDSE